MGCCRKLFEKSSKSSRSVLCRKWVLPLRITMLVSLAGTTIYTLRHMGNLTPRAILLIFIHLALAFSVFNECQRSVSYHKMLAKKENK